ncbi:zinc finger transcription factor ace1 [Fusarium mundagurra]|uniref:Zinc finger transcription factor ace1 n=1 Tax=Fusarium mundagurra TaxID=1567541 RepID=A0A8H5YHA7_9HYPO|nr:zinc finger transcription factor ace1 [Fusarium mundagurra]
MNTIADHVSACLQEFNSLCSSPTTWTDSVSEEGTDSDISLLKLQNELSRFKVWSGNIGAHKKGRSSLDHRLRDASNIRDQVAELLEDLRESLKDAKDILTGQLTPWDQDLSPAEFSEDDSDDEPLNVDASGPSELSQIFAAIVEDINCLLRLSVSIHNPSPHDRFKKAYLTDTSVYEPFDVQHVCNKLSKAPKPIAERLGKAISRRRQYFKYRELHHEKLASGLELDGKDQMQSTVASSLPKKLNVNEPISLEEDLDDASDTGRSQTSWATSAADPERRKIPALPAEAENGPFECPFYDKNEESDSESEGIAEVESEEQDGLEKDSSYVTRLSDEGGDEATDASERSNRFVLAPAHATNEMVDSTGHFVPNPLPWACPISSCQDYSHTWPTEEERDRHYRDKHSETLPMYKCMFMPCLYWSKREMNCKKHLEKVHGLTYIRPLKADKKLPSISDMGIDTAIGKPEEPLDTDSAHESIEGEKDPITHHHIETKAPMLNRGSFDPANIDVLYLRHKDLLLTLGFPRHDIRDGKLRVSKIRERAAGMTDVPESFRHLVELYCKDTKLLIDGTPVRNYGVSRGDTIIVEAPQFRNSNPFSGPAGDDSVLDNGHGTEENMEFEEKAERDERRAEFSWELRQRAMVEPFGYQKAPASSNPQGELREETDSNKDGVLKRTKAGCLTCRMRRIKCDEGRPICNNCIKSKRHCEGYSQIVSFGGSMGAMQGVPVPEIESDLEMMDTHSVSGPIQPSIEADHKLANSSTPGVSCPTCALESKEIWVLPGRCCGYCGTPCADEDTLDGHDSFRATDVNDNEEWFPLFTATGASDSNEQPPHSTPGGPKKKQISCLRFSLNGYCMDGAECPFIHDTAMIRKLGRGSQYNGHSTVWSDDGQDKN